MAAALREREGVAEVEPAVHVRVGKGDEVLLVRRGRRRVLLEDVLGLPPVERREKSFELMLHWNKASSAIFELESLRGFNFQAGLGRAKVNPD